MIKSFNLVQENKNPIAGGWNQENEENFLEKVKTETRAEILRFLRSGNFRIWNWSPQIPFAFAGDF